MADDDQFKLTQEQRDQIANFLTQKGARYPCPACGTNNWVVGDHIIRADLFKVGGTFLGGPSYPLAFVVCQNCFFVRPHFAVALGVIPPEPDPEQVAAQPAPAEETNG